QHDTHDLVAGEQVAGFNARQARGIGQQCRHERTILSCTGAAGTLQIRFDFRRNVQGNRCGHAVGAATNRGNCRYDLTLNLGVSRSRVRQVDGQNETDGVRVVLDAVGEGALVVDVRVTVNEVDSHQANY